ncbi:MAG: dihydroneopterin aldolase [Muribaculaceae bacterium]|nr:dihydroneopterin aldolase [Muribaculaceae bacterium]
MEFEISLNNLIFYAYHGVLEEERKNGTEFRVDLSVVLPYLPEMENDLLEKTVSYERLYQIVEKAMNTPRNLLETIALDIGKKIREEFPVFEKGWIRIEKVRPPIPGMLGSASVKLNF